MDDLEIRRANSMMLMLFCEWKGDDNERHINQGI